MLLPGCCTVPALGPAPSSLKNWVFESWTQVLGPTFDPPKKLGSIKNEIIGLSGPIVGSNFRALKTSMELLLSGFLLN